MEYKPSNAHVIKSVQKTSENEYGVIDVDAIDIHRPCIVVLGGELTDNPRFANHYIKQIKQVLGEYSNMTDIYSIYYNFGSRDTDSERVNIFRKAGHRIRNTTKSIQEINANIDHMSATEPTPQYIKQLYNVLLNPILVSGANGTRVPASTVAQRASNIRFYAHSHGAAVATMLGEYMAKQMKSMGYSANEIRSVQKNIIVIQHGPITTLEHPRFTTLSFASASDTKMNLHNRFSEYAADNSFDLFPSYFPQGGAHLFAAGEISTFITKEHDNEGLTKPETLTEDGQIILSAERNAIVNAVRGAGKPVPAIRDLVSGPGVNFDMLAANGDWFYKNMLVDIKNQPKQIPTHDYQK